MESKRPRLPANVPVAALARFVEESKGEEKSARWLQRDMDGEFASIWDAETSYGPLVKHLRLELQDPEEVFMMPYLCPHALLHLLCWPLSCGWCRLDGGLCCQCWPCLCSPVPLLV